MIKLRGVNKHYQIRENKVPILNDINLDIEVGEFTAIMGPSGSGKSTLMNILGLLDKFSSGQYFFMKANVSHFDAKQLAKLRNTAIGFIFQSFMLLPRMTLIENICLPLLYQNMPTKMMFEKSKSMLDRVGLANFASRKPPELSGGQQQRVAIARALVTEPKMILADEPTGALDSNTGQEIFELLIELNKTQETTIIIVTHDQELALQCQRIVKIQDGQIIL